MSDVFGDRKLQRGNPRLVNSSAELQDIAASQMLDLRQEGFLASGFAMGYCIGPVITGILLDTWQTVQHRGTRITPWPLVVTTQSDDDRSNRVRAGEWGISRWQPDTITTQSPVFFLLDMLGGFLFFWEPGTSTPLNQGQVGKATNIDFVCKSTGTLPSCHWIGFSLATLKSEASFLWAVTKPWFILFDCPACVGKTI